MAGPIIIVIGLIGMILLHEFGHFITARLTGMKVTEYFLGFGPKLWSIRRGETEYGVKAIPAGGYVRIIGMTDFEQVDPAAKGAAKLVGQVQVLITYKGSVFIRPRDAAPKLALDRAEPVKGADGANVLALVLVNTGSAGARVAGCVIHLTAGGKAIDIPAAALAPLKRSRVFAGTRRRYLLPWPKGLPIGPVAATGKCDVEP